MLGALRPVREEGEEDQDRKVARPRLGGCLRGGPSRLEDCSVQVLRKCKDFLVINKPADVRLDGDFTVTVENLAKAIIASEADKPRWVHQLDFATSGVLCIGLTRVAAGNAGKLFQERKTRKWYLAVVKGFMRAPGQETSAHDSVNNSFAAFASPVSTLFSKLEDTALKKWEPRVHSEFKFSHSLHPIQVKECWEEKSSLEPSKASETETECSSSCITSLLKESFGQEWLESSTHLPCFEICGSISEKEKDDFRMEVNPGGREAITQVLPVQYGFVDDIPVTKVLLKPLQGRRHQLRLHLLHMGFPILGDATYGPVFCQATGATDERFFTDQRRMFLHALRLELPFGTSGIRMKKNSNFLQQDIRDMNFETNDPFDLQPVESNKLS